MSFKNTYLPYLQVGVRVTVKHKDGKGGIQITEGKLLDDDDNGYVVVLLDNGQQKNIPQRNVIEMNL